MIILNFEKDHSPLSTDIGRSSNNFYNFVEIGEGVRFIAGEIVYCSELGLKLGTLLRR